MTQLAKIDHNTSLAVAELPEHLRGEVGNRAGKDNFDSGDMLIPRLALAQAMTPQLKRTNENYNPELREGQFFNSVTGEIYGERVTVVPLHFFKQYIEFGEDRSIIKIYENGEIPPITHLAFNDGVKPRATEFKNRMSLLINEEGNITPIVVSFKSTGLKAAKKWNYLIAEKNLPAYAFQYTLEAVAVPGEKGEYFTTKITRGEYTPAALYAEACRYFSDLRDAGVRIDTSGIEQEEKSTRFDEQSPF
jgi:hypothetical protein